MKKSNLLVVTALSTVLACSSTLLAGERMSEPVDQRSLPAVVQKTIMEKAAGGKVLRVEREDDKNGRWNYEVVVNSGGKDWSFEVSPNGTFLRKHEHLGNR